MKNAVFLIIYQYFSLIEISLLEKYWFLIYLLYRLFNLSIYY